MLQLKLRLKTLLDKKRMMQSRNAIAPKISASFITLEEGFQQFGTDLNKLQVCNEGDHFIQTRTKRAHSNSSKSTLPLSPRS